MAADTVRLDVSVVVYRTDYRILDPTLDSLGRALEYAARCGILAAAALYLVDNNPDDRERLRLQQQLARTQVKCRSLALQGEVISGHGNIGYGAGHNLVPLRSQVSEYRLILNPDVVMAEDALRQALQFMEQAPECGLLAPAVTTSSGTRQYLCRRLPGIAELLLRGFAPQSWRRRFEKRLHYYEMRDRIGCAITAWDPPLVSGCFMLLRSEVMERTGGFDPGYFLYFEDYDLSLRAAAGSRPVYRPGVRIVHHGGGAAHKGWRHVLLFARSACRFFRRHYGRRTDAA